MTITSSVKDPSRLFDYKAPLVILALFFLSLIPRINAFDGTIDGGHVWLTAHTVMTLQIWFDEGITTHNFQPVYTYAGKPNQHMLSLTSGLMDKEGNYYYVSYGPFSFYFAFVILKILGIYPTLASLQVINIGIHLVTCWLVYLVICKFYREDALTQVYLPALFGSIIYMFSMHPLWCHTYIYFADVLIQPLWLAGIYLATGIFFEKKVNNRGYILGLGFIIFITVYTEWLGLFFSGTLFCIALLYALKDRSYAWLLLVIAAAVILAFSLYIIQFSSINDFSVFWDASFNKYTQRSGYDYKGFYLKRLNALFVLKHYFRLYYPIIIAIIFLSITTLVVKNRNTQFKRKSEYAVLILLLLAPIFTHHTVFLGFTKIHDFALLKFSVFAAVTIGILIKIIIYNAAPQLRSFPFLLSCFVLSILLTLSLISYYDYSRVDYKNVFVKAADIINKTAQPDEALFILSEKDKGNGIMVTVDDYRSIAPQLQMLTKRNFLGIRDKDQAIKHLQRYNLTKGRIYTVSKKSHVIHVETVSSSPN